MGIANAEQFKMRSGDLTWQEHGISPDQVQSLFEQLEKVSKKGQNEERALLRDHLVILHGALVEHCARNLTATNEPLEDLVQEGYVGLIKAVDRYNPQQGVRFSTYACHLINGEIRHYLRDLGRLIHEPGWHFELRTRVIKVQEELTQRLSRQPLPQEIARTLGIELKTVQDVLKNQQSLSVDFLDQHGTDEDDDGPKWEHKSEDNGKRNENQIDNQLVLGEAFPHLQEVEKKALMLHFFQDCTKTEVARQLGISINHASYILKRGLETLRRMIETSDKIQLPPSQKSRARAAVILQQAHDAAGIEHSGIAEVEHHVSPSSLIPGMTPFANFVELIDIRLNTPKAEDDTFSLLWLRVRGWENAVAEFDPALRREASAAVQILTRKSCRVADYVTMLTSPEWPGLHFVVYLPNTGISGSRVGKRWQERCQASGIWPSNPEALTGLRPHYSFSLFPRDGETCEDIFRKLGQGVAD